MLAGVRVLECLELALWLCLWIGYPPALGFTKNINLGSLLSSEPFVNLVVKSSRSRSPRTPQTGSWSLRGYLSVSKMVTEPWILPMTRWRTLDCHPSPASPSSPSSPSSSSSSSSSWSWQAEDWELKGSQNEYYFLLTTYGARMAGMDKAC